MTNTRVTPPVVPLSADDLEAYKAQRRPSEFGGCYMCQGLFVKATGGLGCSCQIGYYADMGNIAEIDMGAFVKGPLLRYIRESFKDGYEPFEMCARCYSKTAKYPELDLETSVAIHVEPSNSCNLWCSVCLCTEERRSNNEPPRVNLDVAAFEKMLHEIKAAGLTMGTLALVGYGEPLFNSDTPRMAAMGRALFPDAYIFIDTNCNFGTRRAREIADCGLSEVRLALDGVDQESYEGYRRGGNFAKAVAFTRHLADAVRETGSGTKLIWKYIMFNHNDGEDQLRLAIGMAKELGVEIQFDYTFGDRASKRSKEDLDKIIGSARTSFNLDRDAQKAIDRHIAEAAEQE